MSKFLWTLALVCLCLSTCRHDHDHAEHASEPHKAHGEESGHEAEQGHAHGESERSLSAWSPDFEVFLAYADPHSGEATDFFAHLTDLKESKALAEGRAELNARSESGVTLSASSERAERLGIWLLALNFPTPGKWSLRATVTAADGRSAAHELGVVHVLAPGQAAEAGEEKSGIAFSKEQQWAMDFATAAVEMRRLNHGIELLGVVRARTGSEAWLIAPASGQLVLRGKPQPPVPGTRLVSGQILAELNPFHAAQGESAALSEKAELADHELRFAESERDRIRGLVESEVLPARRLAEAELALKRATAADAYARALLASRDGQGGTQQPLLLKAPLSGSLIEWSHGGGPVEAGQRICQIADLSRLWLVLELPESELGKLGSPSGASFATQEGSWLDSRSLDGKLISVGDELHPLRRTLPVIFEINRPKERVPLGSALRARLYGSQPTETLTVPRDALFFESGRRIVIVQVEGERFEKRPVELGVADGDWWEVRSGLRQGERFVVRGVSEVALAAAAGSAPSHGHSH